MSSRKPPSNPDDWDDFDIPTWDDSAPKTPNRSTASSQQARPSSGIRRTYPEPTYEDDDQTSYPARQLSQTTSTGQPPTRLSSRVPSRTTRPSQDPYRDPASGFDDAYADDPYYPEPQYAPRAPSRAAASSQYDLYADPAIDAGWEGAPVYDDAPARRRGRTSRERTRATRPALSIVRPAISDGALATIVGLAALSLVAMAGVVWWGTGDLADFIPWHLNASGDVDVWVTSSALWRLPLAALMALVIGIVLGAYLWKRDRFAARFIVSSMCIVQVLAWVAVIDQLW